MKKGFLVPLLIPLLILMPSSIFLVEMERHLIAAAAGVLGGAIPNTKSNIHPYLMGAILAVLAVKVFVGDYDKGYSWTFSDIGFIIITGLEGVLGAALITWTLRK